MKHINIIAEIGLCHEGSLETAKKLIDLAWVAGCDYIKFQKRTLPDAIPVGERNKSKQTPWGEMTYLEYKYKMEFEKEEFDEIDSYCGNKIQWSASVWDLKALDFLKTYNPPFIKIPSALMTDDELVLQTSIYCCEHGIPIIVSTGMSNLDEIAHAYQLTGQAKNKAKHIHTNYKQVFLHCNSSYPAKLEELNLSGIQTLQKNLPFAEIGWSGHEFRILPSIASIYLGAKWIERHITLDRESWIGDALASVEPQGLIKLVRGVRELQQSYGDGEIKVYDSELGPRKKLRGY